jgi:kynureninase
LLSGVNYHTGQRFDLARLAAAARSHGVVFGADLAHAVGNVPLRLHDWNVDFAVWCSYKYLSGGPGAIGGCFVHSSHASDVSLPRLGGWWGADPATRFHMPAELRFAPVPTADGWQVSNPPVFAMAPLRAALEAFDAAGVNALREKSVRLTGFLERLVDRLASPRLTILTPRDPEARGCQLSVRIAGRARELFAALRSRGIVCDFREPDIIRVAPMPLYNTFHEVWRFARALEEADAQLSGGVPSRAAGRAGGSGEAG